MDGEECLTLSNELFRSHGIRASDKTMGKLLRQLGYSLQATKKTVEGRNIRIATRSLSTSTCRRKMPGSAACRSSR